MSIESGLAAQVCSHKVPTRSSRHTGPLFHSFKGWNNKQCCCTATPVTWIFFYTSCCILNFPSLFKFQHVFWFHPLPVWSTLRSSRLRNPVTASSNSHLLSAHVNQSVQGSAPLHLHQPQQPVRCSPASGRKRGWSSGVERAGDSGVCQRPPELQGVVVVLLFFELLWTGNVQLFH